MRDQALKFGRFQLLPNERKLLENDKPVQLGARALDILIALSERPGELLSKDELIARVWPGIHVEEANLRVHIVALRKALGDGRSGARYISNIPGRGYCFTAPVTPPQNADPGGPAANGHRLPPSVRMIGRADATDKLKAKLPQRRFVSIVGPGGIGKTTLALAMAERLAAHYRDGVVFVDLAPLDDPDLVASTLASVLGVSARAANPMGAILSFLQDREMLLVLDNCEHVIAAAARLAEAVFKGSPGVHILATSQEPLRAEGEWVQRLFPLPAPARQPPVTAAEALTFPAVELFAERVTASFDAFELRDDNVATVTELCRTLDGNPLAIELAAARVEQFGLAGLHSRLADRFAVLTRGRRTALPRHQTLRATLDWSYKLLPEIERVVLRRLAIFKNAFTPEAAATIAADDKISTAEVLDAVGNLAAKSLIAVDLSDETARDRLLETTRAYALEKLAESGEAPIVAARHAEHCRALMTRAESEWETTPAAIWLATYGRTIDDIRAALDWAFAENGDVATGVALAIASAPLWFQLSLPEEYLSRIERILDAAKHAPTTDAEQEMRLSIVFAQTIWHARGPVPGVEAAFRRALEIAERLSRTDLELQALWGIWSARNGSADYPVLLALAERMDEIAAGSRDDKLSLICSRNLAFAHHYLGNHAAACRHAETALGLSRRAVRPVRLITFQVDHQLAMQTLLAPSLWLRGYPDKAMQGARECVEAATAAKHNLSLCYALSLGACPVAIWTGDFDTARRYAAMLEEHAARHSLIHWQNWGICFAAAIAAADGDMPPGGAPRAGATEAAPIILLQHQVLATLNPALSVPELIAHAEERHEGWCAAELLRIKGDALAREETPEASRTAEAVLRRSLDVARRQGALSWQLRSATSLATHLRGIGRVAEARDLLSGVYAQFTEGFATADLQAAERLIAALRPAGASARRNRQK